ncbi:hypothetical protein R1sor_002950 [Riccia sorocarpa]|uniref:CDC20/Fizzy WD40 domain-containing protein n=1 Tax=Riccia sorocarpa TaxID=122646 RepID=A0ABD3H0K7_9MARC
MLLTSLTNTRALQLEAGGIGRLLSDVPNYSCKRQDPTPRNTAFFAQGDGLIPCKSPMELDLVGVSGRTPRRETQGDRFIPCRRAMDMNAALYNLTREPKENTSTNVEVVSPQKEQYRKMLAESIFQNSDAVRTSKVLSFQMKPPLSLGMKEPAVEVMSVDPTASRSNLSYRNIPKASDRVLDAPDLVDDYYLNLLDWSCKNVVAVALGTTVYLWNADTGEIYQLMSTALEDDYVTSVAWAPDGNLIALGMNTNEIQLWDTVHRIQMRRLRGHSARVASLSWNRSTLSSGGRDCNIINHDVRIRDHITSQLSGHTQEVCGLKWSLSGQQLASGGNDNLLHIWDLAATSSQTTPYLYRFGAHQAAVKALAWCPFQSNLLASGGGTADRCIRFWNTQTGACLNTIDTYSQVCALQWNQHHKEILSSHGFSQFQLCVWRYPTMEKMAELTGHTARVLHLAQSPDGTTVVSAAADETLHMISERGQKKQKGDIPLAAANGGCDAYDTEILGKSALSHIVF